MRFIVAFLSVLFVASAAALAQEDRDPFLDPAELGDVVVPLNDGASVTDDGEEEELPGESLPTLFVSAFRFEGNTVVQDHVLEALLQPAAGRELTIVDLHAAAAAVA